MTVAIKSLAAMTTRAVYDKLAALNADIATLAALSSVLGWDQQTMMPPKGADVRTRQSVFIDTILHERASSKELGDILHELQARQKSGDLEKELNEFELANIRIGLRDYKQIVLKPVELAQARSRLSNEAPIAWTAARKESDFSKLAPFLKDWIKISRDWAQIKIKAGTAPEASRIHNEALSLLTTEEDKKKCFKGYYQALMDDYEIGFKQSTLVELFDGLKEKLVPLIAKIKAKGQPHDDSCITGNFDIERQTKFSHRIATELGFDTDAGRLDVSAHPMTTGTHPNDVRMTTRYTENLFSEGITSTIHETGHSLYEQGRNKKYDGQPVSQAMSLGIHESQSLLWERMVGLGRPFWTYALPILKEMFPEKENVQSATVENIYNAFNRVEPGFIRVEADEVTYHLHVILRYELELALIEGELEVEDIPKAWNQKMKDYLGVEVTEDRVGCLQDIHWSVGLWGYFPTYSLGAINAVQIFNAAKKQIPDLEAHLAKGDFHILKEWLNKNVHEKGSLYQSGEELITVVTGEKLNVNYFINHLVDKYTAIYDL
ncbi:hypothetical protein DFQ26_004820 [Actinomortierella ambigua]|nr:hypothetical protein DFQ26_004820 [Actinomortierella ambigua]